MKRFRSTSRRSNPGRSNPDRRRYVRLQAFQCLEDRSLMALTAEGAPFLVADAARGSAGVSANANGDYLVTYSGAGEDDSQGVFARRYNASGTPLTENLLINGTTAGYQGSASGALGTDRAVIVWSGRGEGDSQGIFAGVFGAVNSDEIAVNVTKGGVQESPVVALAANGSFVVAWSGMGTGDRHGIFLRQFAADGTPLTGEVLVNGSPGFLQKDPSIAMNAAGQVVVTWLSLGQDGDGWGVFGQRFNANLTKAGTELQINSDGNEQQTNAQVSIASDGSFVVAWGSQTASWEVLAQRFAANGNRQGGEVQVNTGPLAGLPQVDVASAPNGPYVVAWTAGPRSTTGIFGQAYLADGTADGGEFRVTSAAGPGAGPSVALDQQGDAIFAWSGQGGANAIQLESDRDRTPPTITASLTSTVGNDGTVTQVTIGGTITDINPVTGILVNVDGGAFHDIAVTDDDLNGPYTITFAQLQAALGTVPVGSHTIGVRAEDEDGNLSTTVNVNYNLDLPPVVTVGLTTDTGSSTDRITTVPTISGTVTDAGTVPKLEASINGGAFEQINTATTNHVGAYTITEATLEDLLNPATLDGTLDDGQYTVRVRATDNKQNVSQIAELTFTLDRVAPTVLNEVVNPSRFEDDDFTLDMDGLFSGTGLVYSVVGNTNPNVLTATAQGSEIAFDLYENRNTQNQGQTAPTITVRATKPNGLFVDESFQVNVIAEADAPTVARQLQNLGMTPTQADMVINLGGAFGDVDQIGTLVRFETNMGNIGVELFNSATPISVANFLKYANDTTINGGDYDNSIIHRSANSPRSRTDPAFVIQGGGFKGVSNTTTDAIPTDGTITNEPGISNTPGTLAMARSSGVNSATSQWFFNIGNNTFLDNSNSGFTVFGRILGNGMNVVNAIADLPRVVDDPKFDPDGTGYVAADDPNGVRNTVTTDDLRNLLNAVFAEAPLRNYTFSSTNTPTVPTADQLVRVLQVVQDPTLTGAKGDDSALTYTVTSSDTNIVGVSLNGKRLTLDAKASGVATITVTARDPADPAGVQTQQTFTVTVSTSDSGMVSTSPSPTATQFQPLGNKGVKIWDVVEGSGQAVAHGSQVTVHYTGWLASNGQQFDTSRGGNPATFSLNGVIEGWYQAIPGMKPGGIRRLFIPAALAYGASGTTGIPPNSDLVFEVKLLANPPTALTLSSEVAVADDAASLEQGPLTPQLQAIVDAAVVRWAAAGLDAELVTRLSQTSVQVSDLPGNEVALASDDGIWLDIDAGGAGWFLDATPDEDLEFVDGINSQLGVDLLSVVAHELGHVLGLADLDTGDGLMGQSLSTGARRLPTASAVDLLFSS